MLISAMLGVVSFADTEAAGPVLKVSKATVEFGSSVYIYIAVDYSAFGSSEGITLNIKNNKTNNSVNLTPDTSLEALEGCVAFKYDTIGAKHMGDELTIQAMKDGKASGDAKTFSVLEYALKAEGLGDAKLTALMEAMLAYGSAAQTAYNYKGTYDLAKDYGFVVVKGSNEGKKLAEVGATATFTPNTAKTGANASVYDYSLNKKDTATFTITAGAQEYLFIGDAQKTTLNLNVETSSLTGTIAHTTGSSVTSYVYTNQKNTGTVNDPSGSRNKMTFTTGDVAAGDHASFEVVTNAAGRTAIDWTISKTALIRSAAFVSSTARQFTISTEFGSTDTVITNGFRPRASSSNGNNLWTLSASNGGWNIKAQDGTVITHIGKYTDITIHMVFDLDAKTITYYTDNGANAYTQAISDKDYALLTNSSFICDWTYWASSNYKVLETYVYKMIGYNGNIFE